METKFPFVPLAARAGLIFVIPAYAGTHALAARQPVARSGKLEGRAKAYRGREALTCSPPSEPYRRFSRIRLSSRRLLHRVGESGVWTWKFCEQVLPIRNLLGHSPSHCSLIRS